METVKEINLEQLEEKYGKGLIEKLEEHIAYSTKENIEFKIEVVCESQNFSEIAFVSCGYAYIYEVSRKRKKIIDENRINWEACEKIAKLMNQL